MSELRVPDLNKVFLAGRLTRDPELKYTASGMPYCKVAVANTRYYKGKDGERKEETLYADVTVWGQQAEWTGNALKKGRAVLIEGSLRQSEWEDRETGQKRKRLEINAQRMTPLDWEDRGEGGSRSYGGGRPAAGESSRDREPVEEPVPEDDLPF